MNCSCSKFIPEEGRYRCDVSGDGCMFMIPDSKLCAEMYGEGPDVQRYKCEDCIYFYLEDGERCCKKEPLHFKDGEFIKSKYLYNLTYCGGYVRN